MSTQQGGRLGATDRVWTMDEIAALEGEQPSITPTPSFGTDAVLEFDWSAPDAEERWDVALAAAYASGYEPREEPYEEFGDLQRFELVPLHQSIRGDLV